MRLVRHSVFETNSSSCHSVSVGRSGVYESVTPDENGHIALYPHEFGWDETVYNSVDERLSYGFIYARDYNKSLMDQFKRVVFAHTGATSIDIKPYDSSWGAVGGSIDHQSGEDGKLDFACQTDDVLKSFLFDSSSYVQGDNDNH